MSSLALQWQAMLRVFENLPQDEHAGQGCGTYSLVASIGSVTGLSGSWSI